MQKTRLEQELLPYALMLGLKGVEAEIMTARVVQGYFHLTHHGVGLQVWRDVLSNPKLDVSDGNSCIIGLITGRGYTYSTTWEYEIPNSFSWQCGLNAPQIQEGMTHREVERYYYLLTELWKSLGYVLFTEETSRNLHVRQSVLVA